MSEQPQQDNLDQQPEQDGQRNGQVDVRTFYDRVGGSEPVHQVIHRFYEDVLGDQSLAHYFAGVDMAKQRRHLALLIIQLLGGPKMYDGRELGEAHRGLHITEADYDKVVGHLVAALQHGGVPDDIIAALGATVAEVRPLIVADGIRAGV